MTEKVSGILLDSDDSVRYIFFDSDTIAQGVAEAIDCDLYDGFTVAGMKILVDDLGMRNGAPFNTTATVLVHQLGGRQPVFGRAVVLGLDRSGELASLSHEQVSRIAGELSGPPNEKVVDRIVDTLASSPPALAALGLAPPDAFGARLAPNRPDALFPGRWPGLR